MRLAPDSAIGRPSLALSEDQIATVIDLICVGAAEARRFITTGMHEPQLTIQVGKAMRRAKKRLDIGNIEVVVESNLLDTGSEDAKIAGRIDIVLRFAHQFGDEDAYVGVECKRVSATNQALSQQYVSKGVDRFATGRVLPADMRSSAVAMTAA